jgi:hypothetical protein
MCQLDDHGYAPNPRGTLVSRYGRRATELIVYTIADGTLDAQEAGRVSRQHLRLATFITSGQSFNTAAPIETRSRFLGKSAIS